MASWPSRMSCEAEPSAQGPFPGGLGYTNDPGDVGHAARLGGEPLHLTVKEFALLQALAADPARVYLKSDLLRDVWGYMSLGATRTVDAHACRLRKKLAGSGRPYILNVRGDRR